MAAIHVSLNVTNLDRSVDFYERVFGPPAKRKPDYAKFVGAEPEIHLSLEPSGSATGSALSHLGIRVDSRAEVEAWKERLAAAGLAVESENGVCCYADQEKFWIRDPDGTRWEVYTVLADVEDSPERSRAGSEACCPAEPLARLS